MSSQVRIEIDLSTGRLLVEASNETFGAALDRLETFIPRLSEAHQLKSNEVAGASLRDKSEGEQGPVRKKARSKRPRDSAGNDGGNGRYRDYTGIKLPLSDQQEITIRSFYEEKKPVSGKEKLAVALYKVPEVLGKERVSYNEIYAALKICGEKSPPGDLTAELSRLADDSLAEKDSSGLRLKALGRDMVEALPRKK